MEKRKANQNKNILEHQFLFLQNSTFAEGEEMTKSEAGGKMLVNAAKIIR